MLGTSPPPALHLQHPALSSLLTHSRVCCLEFRCVMIAQQRIMSDKAQLAYLLPSWPAVSQKTLNQFLHCVAWLPKRKGVEKRNLSGDSRKCRLHDVLSRELEIEVTPKNVEIAYLKYCLFSISKRIHVHGLKKKPDCKELYKTRSKGSVLQYPTSTPEHHCPKNHHQPSSQKSSVQRHLNTHIFSFLTSSATSVFVLLS